MTSLGRRLRHLDRGLLGLEAASVRLAIAVDCAIVLIGAAELTIADESTDRSLWVPLFADSKHRAGWLEVKVPT